MCHPHLIEDLNTFFASTGSTYLFISQTDAHVLPDENSDTINIAVAATTPVLLPLTKCLYCARRQSSPPQVCPTRPGCFVVVTVFQAISARTFMNELLVGELSDDIFHDIFTNIGQVCLPRLQVQSAGDAPAPEALQSFFATASKFLSGLPILSEDDLSRELRLNVPEDVLLADGKQHRHLLESYEQYVEGWIVKIEKLLNHQLEDPQAELQEVSIHAHDF